MKHLVSKIRTQKTRFREKKASQNTTGNMPMRQSPVVAGLIVILLWISCILLVDEWRVMPLTDDITRFFPMAGKNVLLLAGLLGTGLAFQVIMPELLRQNSRILLLAAISLFSLGSTRILAYFTTTILLIPEDILLFMIPLSITPILVTILVSAQAGIVMGVWASVTAAILFDNSFLVLMMGIVTTLVAVYSVRGARTRAKIIQTGLITGLCKIVFVLSSTAIHWEYSSIMFVLHQSAACVAGGFISAVVVLAVLPAFEMLFGTTSDISLLELSDLGHPLLQRLAIEAPGTYHHSLVVANLAQAAAEEVDANPLLARIGSYFHDIGKLTKPNFFAENMQLRDNPHDNLAPSMSTLVIVSHVKEGLSMAVLHKLPQSIIRIISEHHGTGLLSYFHHKAKTQLEFALNQNDDPDDRPRIDEGDFRYPGPRPSTRESAIICLADATEAASRTMNKNTPGHIENLVHDIVFSRLKDGQLDNCHLTLDELTRIKRSFVFTLTNMLHGRIPYPDDEDRDKQKTKPAPDQQPEN